MESIFKLFNSQEELEIKQSMKEIILNQFKSDLEQLDIYLFHPNLIETMIEDVLLEIRSEIKEKLKEKMFKNFEDSMKVNYHYPKGIVASETELSSPD